ncbi:MAG: hypothetical protein ACRC0X_00595 [Brevinema sp.]
MSEKKSNNYSTTFFNIIFFTFLTIITIFFIYELLIIGNPFFDPISPYILWGSVFFISGFFAIRYLKAIKTK